MSYASVREAPLVIARAVDRDELLARWRATAMAAGTGRGLPQVYGLLQQLDGQVEIDSRPGEGATIHLLLPALEGEAAA